MLCLLRSVYCYSYSLTHVCLAPQQYFIIINDVDTSSINIFVTMMSFPPSATGTPHQQQLQPECDSTMAMTIVTRRQQHSNCKIGFRISKQHPFVNFDMSSINIFVTMTSFMSFPPSATGTPQQQQQLQLECNPTMAKGIVAYRQQHSSRTWIGNREIQHQQQQQTPCRTHATATPCPTPSTSTSSTLQQEHRCGDDIERNRTCRQCREGKDVPATQKGKDAVLSIALIENMLALLLMIEQLECKPTTAMAMAIVKQQSHTVLGVVVECRPVITITKWDMTLGCQQGTRPCQMPGAQ